ncbi:hypothetical protein Poly51_06460 [Rubripirellula tenax]|uniref:Uncharacterized protein n=2 Tax=Rubripirellula tenax TaxID=2528015 RepID=A0A5C6FFS8_9BACT|nr:hypothetical protein Poly51_06460 [Rubripirellula tenax]
MITTCLTFFFTIGVIFYIVAKVKDGTGAKTYAMIGFGMQLLLTVIVTFSPMVLAKVISVDSYGTVFAWQNVVFQVLAMVATGFLVAAIVTGRDRRAPATDPSLGIPRPNTPPSDNPYSVN